MNEFTYKGFTIYTQKLPTVQQIFSKNKWAAVSHAKGYGVLSTKAKTESAAIDSLTYVIDGINQAEEDVYQDL